MTRPADASALLDLAVRCGLLAEPQAASCRALLPTVPDPLAWLVQEKYLAADEAKLLADKLGETAVVPPSLPACLDSSAETVKPKEAERPARIGPYDVTGVLGQGGMGVVYSARDTRLDRDVAVKIIRGPVDKHDLARFRREARVIASLHHPGIVNLYDVGEENGTPYYAMTLIHGKSLAKAELPRRQAVAVIQSVAEAVHFAHEAGVYHRDIKPENILVDESGQGIITDFGLAKRLEKSGSVTVSGMLVGTPAYMSPEQARGDSKRVDRRSDVWGLGATLYFALIGRPPFPAESPVEMLKKILDEEPRPLREIDPKIHPDLETICLKAMEKTPGRRYPTAREFSVDLQRYLDGEPISARPPSAAYRIRKWAVRRRSWLAAAGIGLVLALAGTIALSWRSRAQTFAEAKKRARIAKDAGDWRAAVLESERGLKIRPDAELDEIARLGRQRIDADEAGRRRFRWLQERLKPQEERIAAVQAYSYVAGEEFFEKLKWVEPILAELEGCTADPEVAGYPELWRTMGEGWLLLGEIPRAEEALRHAERLGPPDARVNLALARICLVRSWMSFGFHGGGSPQEWRASSVVWSDEARERFARQGPGWEGSREIDADIARVYRALGDRKGEEVVRLCKEGLRKFGSLTGAEEYWLVVGMLTERSERGDAFTRAIERRPHFAWAYFLRANHRPRTERREKLEDYAATVRIHPRFAAGYNNLAQVRWDLGDREGALQDIDRAIALEPRLPQPFVNRGSFYEGMARWDEAIAEYTRAFSILPDASTLVNRGNAKSGKGDLEAALQDYEEAARLDPKLPDPLVGRALVYEKLGQSDRARDAFDLAVRRHPKCGYAVCKRGAFRRESGDVEGALADHEKAVLLSPDDARAHLALGVTLARANRYADAVRAYSRCIELDPREAEAYYDRGNSREELEDRDGALADFTKAIDLKPDYSEAYCNRGNLRWEKKDLHGAMADFDKAIQTGPRNKQAYNNRGALRTERNELHAAIEDFTAALAIDPSYVKAYINRGSAKEKKGDLAGAVEDFRKALDAAPPDWPGRGYVNRRIAEAQRK